jgi:hypothetical protein
MKGQAKVPSSMCRQPTAAIVFPSIPEGVRVKKDLLDYRGRPNGPFQNTCEADEVSPEVEAGVVAGLRCLQP